MPARRSHAPALLLAGILGALVAIPAGAGVPLVDAEGVPYRWNLDAAAPNVSVGRVTFFIDPRGTTDTITGGKSSAAAIRDAVAAWEVPTTRIRFLEDPVRTATGRNGLDQVNWIGWQDGVLSPLTYAATFPTRDGSRITDADIVFNELNFTWDTRTPGVSGVADIQGIAAHEWGHLLGADHVPLRGATMYFASDPGSIHLRTLADDDVALVGTLYPSLSFVQTTGTLTGKVEITDAADDRAVHVVAVGVGSAEPVASTLTAPDGSWTIKGLPFGSYRVLAAPTLPLTTELNVYWRAGRNTFLPAVAGFAQTNPVRAATLRITDTNPVTVPTMRTSSTTSPALEPNDTPDTGVPISLGDAAAGRFESAGDGDWFRVPLTTTDRVTVSVLAWGLGADTDPNLQVQGPDGNVIANLVDIRPGPAFTNQIEGLDRDVRLVGFTPTQNGTHRIRVSRTSSASGTNTFYVLFVTPASDAPSPQLSTASAAPQRIDADGASTAILTIHPRREDGRDVGAGAVVNVLRDGGSTLGPVVDKGNGDYTVTVTAPAAPGTETFSYTVSTATGTAAVPNAASIVYLGPASPAESDFRIAPRRIGEDGPGVAAIAFTPRDARRELLGDGRNVVFDIGSVLDAAVGPVVSVGGTYGAAVRPGVVNGTADVGVSIDGAGIALTAPLAIGFGFESVLGAARADIAAHLATLGLPSRVTKKLNSADASAAKALAAFAEGGKSGLKRAVLSAQAAVTALETARTRAAGAIDDVGTSEEVAIAIRRLARLAADAAVIANGRDQKRIDAAVALITSGDSLLDAGDPKRAAARFASAAAKAAPLVP